MTDKAKTYALLVPVLLWTLSASISANEIDPGEFRSRRQAYAARAADGVTVLFNALEEDLREFAVDKNFYYLTGAAIPDAILVLSPAHSQHKETLFIPERDLAQEKWTGPKLAPGAETAKQLGVDRVLGLEQFQSEITALMAGQKKLYTVLPNRKGTAPPSTQEGHVSRLKGIVSLRRSGACSDADRPSPHDKVGRRIVASQASHPDHAGGPQGCKSCRGGWPS